MDAPPRVREQFPHVVRFSPSEIRKAVRGVEGINAKVALVITRTVGTMACAYVFGVIALISLPAAVSSGQVIIIVAWGAQTFLQLVLLSIIMVGQSVQSAASDVRAAKEFADTETILDRLDVNTAGGIKEVLDAIHAISNPAAGPTPWPRPTPMSGGATTSSWPRCIARCPRPTTRAPRSSPMPVTATRRRSNNGRG